MLGEGRETDVLQAPKYCRKSDLMAMLARLAIERPKRPTKEAVVRCFKKNLREIQARREEIADVIEEVRRRKAAGQSGKKRVEEPKESGKRKAATTAGEKKAKTEGRAKSGGSTEGRPAGQSVERVHPHQTAPARPATTLERAPTRPTTHSPAQPRQAAPRQRSKKEVLVGKPMEAEEVVLETAGRRKGMEENNSMKQTKTARGKAAEQKRHWLVRLVLRHGQVIYVGVSAVIIIGLMIHSLHRIEVKNQQLQAGQVPVWEKIKESLSFGDHQRAKSEWEEAEWAKAEREEAERREVEEQKRLEEERVEQERLEEERVAKEKAEKERLEQERVEQERVEQERLEQERAEQEKAEQERVEQERAEQERVEQEKAEQERVEQEKAEQERVEQERVEQERVEQERLERERAEQERLEQEQAEPTPVDTPTTSSTTTTKPQLADLLEPSLYLKIWIGFKTFLRILMSVLAVLLASLVILGFVLYLLHLRYKRSVKIQNYSDFLRNNICKRAKHNFPLLTIKELRGQFPALSALEWRSVCQQVALDSNIRESVVLRGAKEEKAWMWVAYTQ